MVWAAIQPDTTSSRWPHLARLLGTKSLSRLMVEVCSELKDAGVEEMVETIDNFTEEWPLVAELKQTLKGLT
jgi:hypothetical protein